MSPARAVVIGHAWITGPTLLLLGAGALLARSLDARPSLGALLGGVVAWGWWSLMVPRWRGWATSRGADPDEVQRLGERTLLLWKKGSALEKTEFGSRREP